MCPLEKRVKCSKKVGSFRTRYSGGIPVGEELAKILLLACCYQEGPRDRTKRSMKTNGIRTARDERRTGGWAALRSCTRSPWSGSRDRRRAGSRRSECCAKMVGFCSSTGGTHQKGALLLRTADHQIAGEARRRPATATKRRVLRGLAAAPAPHRVLRRLARRRSNYCVTCDRTSSGRI